MASSPITVEDYLNSQEQQETSNQNISPTLDVFNCTVKQYTTINGQEKYDQINHEDFKVDLKKFIDPKSNKIKFKLNAILKLLPYNGFYPQQRTVQIADVFNKIYLESSTLNLDKEKIDVCTSSSAGYSRGTEGVFTTLAATQPLFSPGILFNTIKSGIAVDWPIKTIVEEGFPSSSIGSLYDITPYNISLKTIDTRLPFETILDPTAYYKDKITGSNYLPYIDPTHISYLKNYLNYNISDINVPYVNTTTISKMDSSADKNLYKSAINNFLYETVNFFLKNKQLNNFYSREFNANEVLSTVPEKEYCMDLVITKHTNFSMFNTNNYSGSNCYIPIDSLFGPPSGRFDTHDVFNCYLPYTPPYLRENNTSRITLKFFATGLTTNPRVISSDLLIVKDTVYSNDEEDISQYNRMCLDSCLNLNLIEEKDGKIKWYIQTKFETPLINFGKCSYIGEYESNAVFKEYPSYY